MGFFGWGYKPLILTFDPNFQRDIQVGTLRFYQYLRPTLGSMGYKL